MLAPCRFARGIGEGATPVTELLSTVGEQIFRPRVSTVAASALVADFARHPGPKHGIVVCVDAQSPVLAAAIDALAPDDRLTVVASSGADTLGEQLGGEWVQQRVTVV